EPVIDIDVLDDDHPEIPEVDAKLVRVCLDRDYALLTLDTNLAKSAAIAGVRVLNLHALSLALRPPVVTGEDISVQIIKPGRETGQGVGYLDDGTMVVVEQGRKLVGQEVGVRITSVVTTANGRLVFAHLVD
ncbi:MAG: TRAM domain-containing protein, partial [Frankiaceae bacterium]|nr:TRAM domain-containing protein [Frankiaceae bacterium]